MNLHPQLRKFKSFVFDLDGVINLLDEKIEGAPDTVNTLSKRVKILFLTNNTTITRNDLKNKLENFEIKVTIDQIVTAGYTTAEFLKKENPGASVFVIGEDGLRKELSNAGFKLVNLDECGQADYVVVGMDREFTYKKMACAMAAILNGAIFIATNDDPALPTTTGAIPGAGSMVSAIKTCTGKTPILIGKPNTYSLEIALELLKTTPSESVMVGDRLSTDMVAGNEIGMFTVLVLTGATKIQDLEKIKNEKERPNLVLESVRDILVS